MSYKEISFSEYYGTYGLQIRYIDMEKVVHPNDSEMFAAYFQDTVIVKRSQHKRSKFVEKSLPRSAC